MNKIILLFFIISLGLLSSCEILIKDKAAVVVPTLNIREFPTTNSNVIGKLNSADTIIVNETINGFAKFNYNEKDGFVSLQHLKVINNNTPKSLKEYLDYVDFFILIVLSILISFSSWGLVRLGNLILWRTSTFRIHNINEFHITTIEANQHKSRIRSLLIYTLGSNRQHPYLSYWVYFSYRFFLMPSFFLLPVFLIDLSGLFKSSIMLGNFKVEHPAIFTWLLLGTIILIGLYFFKAAKNIHKRAPKKEWIAVLIGFIFAIPTFFCTLFLSLISLIKLTLMTFSIMLRIFAPSKREARFIQKINSDHPNDIPNF